jgi:signal transduction histidine kinase
MLAFAVMVVLSLVLGWLVAGRFLRPLRTITATARYISASNLHRRLHLTGRRDEFTELAATLDDLFARLESSFSSQRHFVANASHELRTPLTAQRALLQVALGDSSSTVDSLRETCREVLALGESQARLIDALLTLAIGERGVERREPLDLAVITASVLAGRRTDLSVDTALVPAPAVGDPELVEILVANLVDNALRHNVSGGRVEVVTGPGGRLAVGNTGPVVPPDELGRLFQPFQRLGTQRVRHGDGYGLGLAIVRAIADAHGARVGASARTGGGLDVEVSFPG